AARRAQAAKMPRFMNPLPLGNAPAVPRSPIAPKLRDASAIRKPDCMGELEAALKMGSLPEKVAKACARKQLFLAPGLGDRAAVGQFQGLDVPAHAARRRTAGRSRSPGFLQPVDHGWVAGGH